MKLIVAIPARNAGRYIAATIDSVLRSTRTPDRIVVFDDDSGDATETIAKGVFGLEIISNRPALGYPNNANACLSLASQCDFLHILPSDDTVKPTFYERMIEAMSDEHCLAFTQPEHIDDKGNSLGQPHPTPNVEYSWRDFLRRSSMLKPIYLCGALIHTRRFNLPQLFNPAMPQLCDLLAWARLAEHTRRDVTQVNYREPLCKYRVHGDSITAKQTSNLESFVKDEWRIMLECDRMLGPSAIRRRVLRLVYLARTFRKL